MSDASDWARIKALFQRALDVTEDRREDFVIAECGDDIVMLQEVRSMLDAHASHATLLQGEARELLDTPTIDHDVLPAIIGPFKPVARIGRGGMGVVYRAERDIDGGTQTVALKLIAAGFSERALVRRFERERSILARLQHPKIDLANCIGCGACVRACPEDGVLALAHHPDYIRRLVAGDLSPAEQRAIGFPWSPEMVERSRRSTGATRARPPSAARTSRG